MPSTSIFLGAKGEVLAVDRATGQQLWRTKLAGGDFVNLILDEDRIVATSKGKAFCLDAATGQLLWRNDLPGLGFGLVSIATASGSTPSGPPSERRRQQQAAAAVAVTASAAGS